MDYFAIVCFDTADSSRARASAVDAHRDRLKDLQEQDRLLTAGPLPRPDAEGIQGSIIIAAFDSLAAAREWAQADPYNDAGVYERTAVYPYKRVF